jgi:hypothetical protein
MRARGTGGSPYMARGLQSRNGERSWQDQTGRQRVLVEIYRIVKKIRNLGKNHGNSSGRGIEIGGSVFSRFLPLAENPQLRTVLYRQLACAALLP